MPDFNPLSYLGSGDYGQFVTMFVWGLLFFGVLAIIGVFVRNRFKYRYYGEVYRMRQENWQTSAPSSKKQSGKAGYFHKKGRPIFRIKYGFMPWQQIDVNKLPDPKYMLDNEASFIQYNVGELVQAKKIINTKTSTITVEPVESTTKSAAKSELRDYKGIFTTQSKIQENMGVAIMGFLLITGIITLYFVNKACAA